MFTSKIRMIAVAFAVALTVGVVTNAATPSADAAIKATATGNSQKDDYCSKVADLINTAMQEGNHASAVGDSDSAAQWYALAEYMARDATSKGCQFTQARVRVRRGRFGHIGGQLGTQGSAVAKTISSHPTGDADLDRWCSEIAGLVNGALDKEQEARAAGQTAIADAWRDYANRMLAVGRSQGCDWYAAHRAALDKATVRVAGLVSLAG